MPEIVADLPSLHCYFAVSEAGIQGFRSLGPDPFLLRARVGHGRRSRCPRYPRGSAFASTSSVRWAV